MKRAIFIIVAAIFSCGFLVQTAAERKEIERRVREWKKTVSVRYDFGALTAFVNSTASEKKTWDGVDLTKPAIGAKWKFSGCSMMSGDWWFTSEDPKKDEFELKFVYADRARAFTLRCVREGKKSFRAVEGHSYELIELDL